MSLKSLKYITSKTKISFWVSAQYSAKHLAKIHRIYCLYHENIDEKNHLLYHKQSQWLMYMTLSVTVLVISQLLWSKLYGSFSKCLTLTQVKSFRAHILMVLSADAVARTWSTGENWTHQMPRLCPRSTPTRATVSDRHNCNKNASHYLHLISS